MKGVCGAAAPTVAAIAISAAIGAAIAAATATATAINVRRTTSRSCRRRGDCGGRGRSCSGSGDELSFYEGAAGDEDGEDGEDGAAEDELRGVADVIDTGGFRLGLLLGLGLRLRLRLRLQLFLRARFCARRHGWRLGAQRCWTNGARAVQEETEKAKRPIRSIDNLSRCQDVARRLLSL